MGAVRDNKVEGEGVKGKDGGRRGIGGGGVGTILTVVLCVSDFVNFSMDPERRLATDCTWGKLVISAASCPLI